MNEGLIARRYATAILKVAQAHGAAGEVYEKMKLFEQNYIAHPDLQKALMNPVLSPADKENLLTTAIGIEPGMFYVRGIRLLIHNHREMYIRQIALMCKMAGADIHHIGDSGYMGMALPENITAYSVAIRGKRHTYRRMAMSLVR